MEDLYIEEVERIASELEESGMHPDKAYDLASELGYDALRDRLADQIDYQRMMDKVH